MAQSLIAIIISHGFCADCGQFDEAGLSINHVTLVYRDYTTITLLSVQLEGYSESC